MRRVAAVLSAVGAAAAVDGLQAAIQKVLDKQAAKACPAGLSCIQGHVLQLSWRDGVRDFSLAAGTYHMPDGSTRPCTTDDTFVYGSGTKPFTAAGVMSLVEQGVVGLDDSLGKHVDPVLHEIKPGTSLQSLWGQDSSEMTVRQVIGMRAGIADYDGDDGGVFDDNLLVNDSVNTKVHTPVEFLEAAAKQGMKCKPGACERYSSASMILAGLVLMRHMPGRRTWTEFDARYPFKAAVRASSLAETRFYTDEAVTAFLTGPGYSSPYDPAYGKQVVWGQNGSIMGLGCANMAAPTRAVSRFFWQLLGEGSVLNATSVAAMVAPLDQPGSGYGLGLSQGSVFEGRYEKRTRGTFGTWLGHVGDVYGFAALEGMFYGPNASIAIATNFDDGWESPSSGFLQDVACGVLQAYAGYAGLPEQLNCTA
eukprot:TRINITY_DN13279_c3_g3_i1.p1 TRINITY_DN13279_c3_g3~~TRINITY_DN13279_c3_g3_i1.p1  ORF type:complete len:422 (+),score=114.49 TRINITY_DN13279_c3_g3_i1:47-1312(+)